MSIVASADSIEMPAWMLVIWALGSLLTVGLMMAFGAFRRRPDETLFRLFAPDSVQPLLYNILVAAGVYLGSSVIGWTVIMLTQRVDPANPQSVLVGGNLISIAILMQAAAALSLLVGLMFIDRGHARVGFDRSPLHGIRYGAGLILAIMPLMLLVVQASEMVYKWAGVQKEHVHELLDAMRGPNPLVRLGGVIAAVVMAPLTEEIFFRGHLQPILRRMFTRSRRLPPPAPMMPMTGPGLQVSFGAPAAVPPVPVYPAYPAPMPPGFAAVTVPPLMPAPLDYRSTPPPPPGLPTHPFGASLAAILITSAIFAVIHPMWSWPAIFVLSLALGYAYERTGNLWVPIVMHACFNGLNVALFLSQL